MPTTLCSPPVDTSGSDTRREYAAPLRLRITPSPWLRRVFSFLHLAAALALFLTSLPVWVNAMILSVLAWRARHHWLGQPALHAGALLLWDAAGQWYIDDGNECYHLQGEVVVTPMLLLLRLRADGGERRDLLIPADAVAAEPLRRLRVRLALESA